MSSHDLQSDVHRRTRWYHFTPGRLLILLFLVQAFLLLSNKLQWFWIGRQKGIAVLICLAVTAAVLLIMPMWLVVTRWLRMRFQFGLASLLLLVTSVAIACGWFAHELRKAKQQETLAATAWSQHVGLLYDYNISGSGSLQHFTGRRPDATWLHDLLGDDFFHDIAGAHLTLDSQLKLLAGQTSLRQLHLRDSQITDDGLQPLSRFQQLEELVLDDSEHVTDAGLQHISRLTNLRRLLLRRTPVGDQGMSHLKELRNLEYLDLGMTQVTDKGLVHLGGLKKLRQLLFWGNRIDDSGLAHLRGMDHLQYLELGGAPVTDAGLEHLADLTHLQHVRLRGSRLTDEGLRQFSKWKQIQLLDLFNTQVSDQGLVHLTKLRSLTSVHLGETQVSDQGVAQLQQALPGCKIDR